MGYNTHAMKLDIEHIEAIATLARLQLNDQEKAMYADQLSVVLDYVDMLGEVDTEGVSETCQVTGLEDVVREDVVEDCPGDVRKKIIDLFPEKDGDFLKVKAVFDT